MNPSQMLLRGAFSILLPKTQLRIMGLFLAMITMMITGSVVSYVIVRNVRSKTAFSSRIRATLVVMSMTLVLVACDFICCGGSVEYRIPFDMAMALLPMLVLSFSLWDEDLSLKVVGYLILPMAVMTVCYILQGAGVMRRIPDIYYIGMAGVAIILICFIFMVALTMRIMQVRLVLRNGNVWSSVCMMIDIMYLLFLVIGIMIFMVSALLSPSADYVISCIVSLLLTFHVAALGLRVSFDSLFMFWRRHERRIVESMKISRTDAPKDSSKVNEIYRDIYSRLVNLFETEKVYLNSELTMNDVVKIIFTNKLYISRAISQFTGKNFCQFVNYYRVSHSIELFRDNPELKVVELASQSGFNSTVSYSMAFRLYMSECPSDWCRKEKLKLSRRKK